MSNFTNKVIIVVALLLLGAVVGIISYNTLKNEDTFMSNMYLKEITDEDIDIWMTADGRVSLVRKDTGQYVILSDSLSKEIMLTQLKLFYVEELRKLGELNKLNEIEEFFNKRNN